MAYQLPLFGWLHAAALGQLSSPNPATAGRDLDRLVDYRIGQLFQFATSESDHRIDLDRGAGTLEAVDRVVIPEGHNLDGATLTFLDSPDDAVYTPIGSVVAGTGPIDLLIGPTSARYLRVTFTGTGRWELTELWYTARRSTSFRGPDVPWVESPFYPQLRRSFPGGDAVAVLGPERFRYVFDHNALAGADLGVWDDLFTETQGGALPFLLWGPDDADPPVVASIVRWDRSQDNPAPGTGVVGLSYLIRAEFVEASW